MINDRVKTGLMTILYGLVLCCLMVPTGLCAEEEKGSMNREERARINYLLTLETDKDITTLLSKPVELLTEQILKDIEKKHDIEIKRSSMVKADVCLSELLTGIAHLAKISAGHKIQRVIIKLESSTSRASIWNQWRVRKLETPKLSATFYYDDPGVVPSEITCQGHKYH